MTLDFEGLTTSWNSGAEHILDCSAEEAIGQHGRLFFTKEDQAAGSPEHEIQRAESEGRALNERIHMRADGSPFRGSGLLMRRKGSPGFVKIVRDRTLEREV